MEITFIIQTLGLGGAETFNHDLLVALKKIYKVQITVFCSHPLLSQKFKESGISVSSIPVIIDIIGDWKGLIKAIAFLPWAVWVYGRIIWRSRNSNVILMSGFPEKIIVTLLAAVFSLLGIKMPKIVWVEFGPLQTVFSKFGGLPYFLYHWAEKHANLIITSSSHTYRSLRRYAHIPNEKLIVIPCGRNKNELQNPVALKTKAHRLVCVSRLEKGKGQDLLIKALPFVLKQYPNAHLRIVGEGDFLAELQKLVRELHLEKYVAFTGYVPNVMEEMQQAEVCVFPSMWELEGFGMVLIEAMALGKPIVGFNRGPYPEIISHQETGLLAQPGDYKDLAAHILELLQNPDRAKKLGQAARKVFHQQFTIERAAEQYYHHL